jgi:hypothetical protein
MARDFQIFQAALEIQYDRGVVYYDRCGSLMLRLKGELGAPRFDGNVPAMQYGELRNDAERIVVRYGPQSFGVTQTWMPSLARFEQLCPIGWDAVADSLNVSDQVTRCGVRFWLIWKVDSIVDAVARIERSGLGRCDALLGNKPPESLTVILRDRSGQLRLNLETVAHNIEEDLLPKALAAVVPRYGAQLDVDHAHPSSVDLRLSRDERVPFALSRSQVKDFVRASWQRTRELASKTRELLGEAHGH